MKLKHNPIPWDFLDKYRGKKFEGEWPTIPEMFDISCERYPDNKCFECFTPKHIVFTYKEAKEIIESFAQYLLSLGLKKGDKVGLVGKNSPEWAIGYLATLYAGLIIVPIDNALTSKEIEVLFDFAGIKALLCDANRMDVLGADGKYGTRVCLEGDGDDYILNCKSQKTQKVEKASPEDTSAILFTSGTTGNPKGVMLSHKNITADCYLAQGLMNIYPTDVFYAILPIHHAYTMLAVFIEAISVGANVVFGKKLIVRQIFKELREAKVTMFLGVPMLFNKMYTGLLAGLKKKSVILYGLIRGMMGISGFIKKVFHVNPGKKMFKFLLKQLSLENNRICICGGGPLPSSTFKGFNELGIDFVQGYGLTETSPILTLNPIFDYEEASIGKPVPQVEMRIVDKDADGNGLIHVRGPMIMQGYYNNKKATSEMIGEDGFLNTGDIGHQDSRGFVFLTGRARNIIVTEGGKNVFPEEIEDLFQLYNDIEQICIVGYTIDAELKTEGICALIHPSEDCVREYPNRQDLESHINGIVKEVDKNLQGYKKIRKVRIIDEPLEMTSTKKIKRFVVSKKYGDIING